jgi:quercetin dioxygenase-like cupin family protein
VTKFEIIIFGGLATRLTIGEIEAIVDGERKTLRENNIVIIPAGAWHEFKNRSEKLVFMINLHPVSEIVTEWAS